MQDDELASAGSSQCLVEEREQIRIEPLVVGIGGFLDIDALQGITFVHERDKRARRFLVCQPPGGIAATIIYMYKGFLTVGTVVFRAICAGQEMGNTPHRIGLFGIDGREGNHVFFRQSGCRIAFIAIDT